MFTDHCTDLTLVLEGWQGLYSTSTSKFYHHFSFFLKLEDFPRPSYGSHNLNTQRVQLNMLCNCPLFSLHFYACRLSVNHYHEIPKFVFAQNTSFLELSKPKKKKDHLSFCKLSQVHLFKDCTNPGMSGKLLKPFFSFPKHIIVGHLFRNICPSLHYYSHSCIHTSLYDFFSHMYILHYASSPWLQGAQFLFLSFS